MFNSAAKMLGGAKQITSKIKWSRWRQLLNYL